MPLEFLHTTHKYVWSTRGQVIYICHLVTLYWLARVSSVAEHHADKRKVPGSNPTVATKNLEQLANVSLKKAQLAWLASKNEAQRIVKVLQHLYM